MIASVLVSYTTARSEGLGVKAIIGALSTWSWTSTSFFANRMPQVLWVLAVGSMWTLIQRMVYIRSKLRAMDGDQ
jgi:hypothetical protein